MLQQTNHQDLIIIKCTLLGDAACGKTCAVTRWMKDNVRNDDLPMENSCEFKDILVTEDNKQRLHPSLKSDKQ